MIHSFNLFLTIWMDFFAPSANVLFSSTIITGARNKMNPRIISKALIKPAIILRSGSGINVILNIERVEKHIIRKPSTENMDLY